MKAYGALNSSIESIREFDTPNPIPAADEILIRVRAVSLNPVDTKVRSLIGSDDLDAPRILGFDAAGTVESVGASVENFSPGDEVYYSGDVTRPGSNAELHTVQAALVAKKPSSFTFPEAAALPLVTITAWELLFERMSDGTFPPNTAILIINGAGGVGSALIPLAKSAGLTVVATASRAETSEWCTQLGADHVINHREPLRPQAEAIGFKQFPLIANLHNTETYWETTADLLARIRRARTDCGNQESHRYRQSLSPKIPANRLGIHAHPLPFPDRRYAPPRRNPCRNRKTLRCRHLPQAQHYPPWLTICCQPPRSPPPARIRHHHRQAHH